MLVSTGCTLGALACRVRQTGPVVVVQPADRHGRPVGVAFQVGPLHTRADVTALCDWIRAGTFDPDGLPASLLELHRGVTAAAQN